MLCPPCSAAGSGAGAAETELKSRSMIYKCCCRTLQRFLPVPRQRHRARHRVRGGVTRGASCARPVRVLGTWGQAGRDGAVAPAPGSGAAVGLSAGTAAPRAEAEGGGTAAAPLLPQQ